LKYSCAVIYFESLVIYFHLFSCAKSNNYLPFKIILLENIDHYKKEHVKLIISNNSMVIELSKVHNCY
jgi:hypothetical protein